MISTVDVWSCALHAVLDHECFSPAHSRRQIWVSPSSMSSSSVSPSNSHFSHSTHCGTRVGIHNAHHVVVLRFLLAWTCLPRSLVLPFAGVKRHLFPSFSPVCNLIDCVNFNGFVFDWRTGTAGTSTIKSSTYALPSFLSTDSPSSSC